MAIIATMLVATLVVVIICIVLIAPSTAKILIETIGGNRKAAAQIDLPQPLYRLIIALIIYTKQLPLVAAAYQQAADIRRRCAPVDDPLLMYCLDNLAQSYLAEGKCAESESLFKQVIGVWQKTDPDLLQLGLALDNYGKLLTRTGRRDEASNVQSMANRILSKW